MTIREVCSCGAEIELYSKSYADTKKIIEAAADWRANHQHNEEGFKPLVFWGCYNESE